MFILYNGPLLVFHFIFFKSSEKAFVCLWFHLAPDWWLHNRSICQNQIKVFTLFDFDSKVLIRL